MARTARRQLDGRHLLFGEYLKSWTALNVHYIEAELNIDGGKHVLAVFKLGIILNEFGICIIWRILEISNAYGLDG